MKPSGYLIVFGLALIVVFVLRKSIFADKNPGWNWSRFRRRFSRLPPLAFIILAILAFVGGALYAPSNYDGLAYRSSRVLHWLAEGRWHWIHTEFHRVNARACGFEWVSAPVLALTHTDRLLFLFNIIPFLLLPGLIFSIFTRFGISSRVAWVWMWLLPGGYCFVLQAGSIGNDLFATALVLAAIDFALRAQTGSGVGNLWLSTISAGLFSGSKANTIPLGLVWFVVVLPSLRQVPKHVFGSLLVALIALTSSFAPTAVLNQKYCGDWSGAAAENLRFQSSQPLVRVLGNTTIFLVGNFAAPIFPFSDTWNQRVSRGLVPARLQSAFDANSLGEGNVLTIGELQTEEGAGLGAGVCWVLAVFLGVSLANSRKLAPERRKKAWTCNQYAFLFAILIASAAFFATSFVQQSTPRLLAPYYTLLLAPLLLFPGHTLTARMPWVRLATVVSALVGGLLLVANPARHLLPIQTLTAILRKIHAPEVLLSRADRVYSVYQARPNAFDPALELTPKDERILGMVTFDDPEAALWKPYGSRRIVHVCIGDDAAYIRAQGVHYVWVNLHAFTMQTKVTFDQWLDQIKAEPLKTITLNLRAGQEAMTWRLVRLL